MATATVPTKSPSSFFPLPSKKRPPRLTLWPLVAATFFMVSGGTYGIEDIVHGARDAAVDPDISSERARKRKLILCYVHGDDMQAHRLRVLNGHVPEAAYA